jgi:cytochrome P450
MTTTISLIGDSVASASGDSWRKHRRILTPAFNTKLRVYFSDS